MREILVYDDYEIHKLGTGGGTQYEEVTTEKATTIDVTDVAKPKGKLIPFGRTEQVQYQGYNLFDYTKVVNLAYGTRPGESSQYILASSLYRGYYIPVTPGEHYFISRKNTTDFNRFRYCYTEIEPAVNVPIISGSQKNRDTYTSFDTVVPEGAGYLFLYLTNEKTDITPEMEVQITKSEELLPYEPFIGGTASPSPDYPQEIRNVEGRSCTNLVGGEWFNGLYNADGSISNTNRNYRSFKTTLKAGTYVYSFKADIQLSVVRNVNITNNENITITNKSFVLQNDSEISLGFRKTDNSAWDLGENLGDIQFQLNEGSTALTYEPYFEGKRLEFNVCNKNLAKALRLGYYVGATGVYVADTTHTCSSEPIKIRNGATYKYSIDGVGVEGYAYEYDESGNYLGRKYFGATSVYTPTNGAFYFNYAFKDSTLANVPLNSKVQIEEGTATSYEEHKQQMIPFPLAEGQKLMEGDYLAEDGVHHVKGKTILPNATGLNAITLAGVAGQYAVYNLPKGKSQGSTSSNNFISDKLSYNYNRIKKYTAYTIARSLVVLTDADDTLENFNSNIRGSIVEYELAEETVDTYTTAQAEAYNKLKNLMLYKGVNHIWTNTDGLEPNLQLTYKRKKQEGVLQVSNIQPLNNLELNNTEETPEEITTEISEE